METNTQFELLNAKKRVKKIKGFYKHLMTYVLVNGFLILLNVFSAKDGDYWFVFPLMGWGIGLLAHAANTFNWLPFLGKDWENRKIKQLMEEERNRWNQ